MDMQEDVFAEYAYGKLALEKFASTDQNFRLYEAGFLGEGNERDVMCIKGAVFRNALRGPNKGKLCIMVPGTSRTAYVTSQEIDAFEAKAGAPT